MGLREAGRQGHETGSRPHRSIGPSTLSHVATRTATAETDWGRVAPVKARRTAPPVLVRQLRNGVEESAHRGDIVEVDVAGRMLRALGDPDHPVNLRSAAKPFALLALLEAGGQKEFELEPAELALMTGSHSGEDLHVRTLQALFRRTGLSQAMLATGTEGMAAPSSTARESRVGVVFMNFSRIPPS